MKTKSSNIKEIIYLLKELKYEFENWNENWVEDVLTTKCSSRNNLLLWILQQFGLFATISFSSSVEVSFKKIHKELLSIGICKPLDINIIEASVNSVIQLKFWKYLLEKILDLKCNISYRNDKYFAQASDNLLDKLISSPYFQEQSKEEDFSLLPADLRNQYSNKEKKGKENLSCHFVQTEQLLDDLGNVNINDQFFVESCLTEDLCQSLSSLNKQVDSIPEIFESFFEPWCNQASISSSAISYVLCSSVNQNKSQLITLMRTFKLEDEIDGYVNDIKTKVVHFNGCNIRHGSIGVLDNISLAINKFTNL